MMRRMTVRRKKRVAHWIPIKNKPKEGEAQKGRVIGPAGFVMARGVTLERAREVFADYRILAQRGKAPTRSTLGFPEVTGRDSKA